MIQPLYSLSCNLVAFVHGDACGKCLWCPVSCLISLALLPTVAAMDSSVQVHPHLALKLGIRCLCALSPRAVFYASAYSVYVQAQPRSVGVSSPQGQPSTSVRQNPVASVSACCHLCGWANHILFPIGKLGKIHCLCFCFCNKDFYFILLFIFLSIYLCVWVFYQMYVFAIHLNIIIYLLYITYLILNIHLN